MSDFGRLRNYGHFFNSRTRPHVNHVLRSQLVGDVLNLVAYRLRCKHYLPPDSPTQPQTVQFPDLDTWKVFKECREVGVGGYSPGQCILHDSATAMRSETLITYIAVTVPAPNVQNCTAIVS